MSAPQFDIIFRGVREGYDASLVKAQFATLFKLDSAKVERIFKSKYVTLKNHADERLANIFVARLLAIGVIADKLKIEPTISKAIYQQDPGETSTDAFAMHHSVEFLYGEHIRRIPFVFSGNGFEYCRLWMINLLVTLLSAGLLYPWAQVRALRYFYQHTQLDHVEFQYASNPQKIFLVQFLLVAYLVILAYGFFHNRIYFLLGVIVLLGVLPWYWLKRSAFQQQHSFYRHFAFRQDAKLQDAYLVFLGYPLLIILSAGILAPYAVFKMQQYWAQTKSIGNYAFIFSVKLKNYFVLLPSLLMAECVTFTCVYWSKYLSFEVSAFIILAVWLLVFLRWRVALVNLQWNGVSSKLGYFVANWDLASYSRLMVRNILLCILTLGFYWPWAKVRSAQYKAGHLAFFANQRFKKWQKSLEVSNAVF